MSDKITGEPQVGSRLDGCATPITDAEIIRIFDKSNYLEPIEMVPVELARRFERELEEVRKISDIALKHYPRVHNAPAHLPGKQTEVKS